MKLADVEAALAANRTPEVLAVYGDALQALGDPRGELIAIDLHAAVHGPNSELAARKQALIDGWLGEDLAARVLEIGAIDCGFVEITWGLAADEVEQMLAHPGLHAALRTFALEDPDPGLRRAIDLVCAARPPWLEHLHVVRYPDGLDSEVGCDIAIDDERAQALVRATPRLRRLTLAGANVFDEFVHPGVHALCVYNYNALAGVLHEGAPLALDELDLQLGETPPEATLATMLPPARVPGLRRLDLARNEALWRDQAFALVGANPVVRQLAWLRVPSVRCDAHLDVVERAAGAMPVDAEVIVARAYADHGPTRAAAPRLRVPPARPWPPPDASRGRLTIVIPGQRPGSDVDLREAIALMEARFDTLAEPERATWIELWRGVHTLSADGFALSARALERALAAVSPGDDHPTWSELRTALAGCTDDALQVRPWSLWT